MRKVSLGPPLLIMARGIILALDRVHALWRHFWGHVVPPRATSTLADYGRGPKLAGSMPLRRYVMYAAVRAKGNCEEIKRRNPGKNGRRTKRISSLAPNRFNARR